MNPKIFTATEANRMLPLVGTIARGAVQTWKSLQTAKRELRKTSARRPRVDEGGGVRAVVEDDRIKNDIRDLERQLDEARGELEELGCYLRDAEKGLIDFPAFVGAELVYLCWFPDEPSVTHYHGMREGFIGRKPIPPEVTSRR
ncbi:MAG: DUF2203 domain-containing protein [Planctomycetota bacterium]